MPRTTLILNTHNFAAPPSSSTTRQTARLSSMGVTLATSDGLFESTGDNDGYETVGEDQVASPIDAHVKLPSSEFTPGKSRQGLSSYPGGSTGP